MTKSMSELDPQDRIHEIIAKHLDEKVNIGKRFDIMVLSEEIYSELEKQGLIEIALITRINSIIIDLLFMEYGIKVT